MDTAISPFSGLEDARERLSYGAVEFEVTHVPRAARFWCAALGLGVRIDDGAAFLGPSRDPLIVLRPGATRPVSPAHSGIYRVAVGVPTQAEFSRRLARLIELRLPFSPVDHLMSKAIYLQDPDGLGIEIALETPERFGKFGDCARGFSLFDREGRSHNGRAPLDVARELRALPQADRGARLAEGVRVAHLHLHVPDLEAALDLFEPLGFARNLVLPHLGFADLGAGGAYTHRLALNVWRGPGLPPAPAGTARLTRYALNVDAAATSRCLTDPTGAEIVVGRQPGTSP